MHPESTSKRRATRQFEARRAGYVLHHVTVTSCAIDDCSAQYHDTTYGGLGEDVEDDDELSLLGTGKDEGDTANLNKLGVHPIERRASPTL